MRTLATRPLDERTSHRNGSVNRDLEWSRAPGLGQPVIESIRRMSQFDESRASDAAQSRHSPLPSLRSNTHGIPRARSSIWAGRKPNCSRRLYISVESDPGPGAEAVEPAAIQREPEQAAANLSGVVPSQSAMWWEGKGRETARAM